MIERIGIVGGGKMGKDIFGFLSGLPFNLKWFIRSKAGFESASEMWNRKLSRKKGFELSKDLKLTSLNKEITLTQDITLLEDCDLIIESITEDQEIKSGLFKKLDQIVNPIVIFASNTSSIPVSSLVPSEKRIEHFIGMHFFYSLKFKKIVEVNILPETSLDTIDSISEFLQRTGKNGIFLKQPDHFLINRLLLPLQAGVYNLHEEKAIPVQLLDRIVKENLFPIGVFEFFDHVGIDIMYNAINNYTIKIDDTDIYLPLLRRLKNMTEEGHLGVKTGRGFYLYPKHQSIVDPSINTAAKNLILDKMYKWYLEPIFEVIAKRILAPQEIDFIYSEYLGIDYSPFDLAVKLGYNSKKK
jgi:3-hydroxybutyryl-CoA dehydrogenase